MRVILTYSLILFSVFSFSQEKPGNKALPKGNRQFTASEYSEAEASYRIARSAEPTNSRASYNLGNAIYRQDFPGEAKYAYMDAIENAKTKEQKHKAFHNLGNVLMKEKNYQAAVEAYKNALRNNPYDEETRYNFALAKKMLKENPPQPQKDDKKDDKKEDKSQKPKDPNEGKGDQKDKGGEGDQKEKEKENNGKNKQDKGDNGKEQEQPAGMSPDKQRMENLLDAMNNEEKKIQDKINARKVKTQPRRQEKDW